MNIAEWLENLPGAPVPSEVAQKAQLSKATLFRHIEKGETTADNVIAISRAYGISPVDGLVELGFLTPDEATSERLAVKEALKDATIAEKWDSIADDIDGQKLIIGHFPRFGEIDARTFGSASSRSNMPASGVRVEEYDDDALIDRINAGIEPIAAQKRTDPLDENYT